MDRPFTLQILSQMTVMALQPNFESHRRSKVLCAGQQDGQRTMRLTVFKYASRVNELQVRKLQLRPCSSSSGKHVRRAERRTWARCSVLNEVGQSNPQVPPGPTPPDCLKDQLEALQDEALQVRNRYNNAKARFMRLTEVALQLRQRAAFDLNLGNEDSARKGLIEKQKVIQAAELSKRRAQLLEELSTKLGEAISVKETQYIVALSSGQREEPTVRMVSPKEEGSSPVDLNLDDEGNPTDLGTAEKSRIAHEVADSVDPAAAATENMNGDNRQVVSDSGDVLVEREKLSLAAELGHSTMTHLYANDEDAEATILERESHNVNLPLGGEGSIRGDRDTNAQSGGSLLPKDSLQGRGLNGGVEDSVSDTGIAHYLSRISGFDDVENLESGSARTGKVGNPNINFRPEGGDSHDVNEEMGSACQDASPLDMCLDGMGHFEQIEGREASGEVSFNDGRSRFIERLILDMDFQFAVIESRIQTEVSRHVDSNESELQLGEGLLEQVQTLRARISEIVVSLKPKEPQ